MHAKPFVKTLAVLALAGVPVPGAGATAQVEFVNPESFTDAGRRYADKERDDNLERLRRHIVERAARELPPGEVLAVWVTDLDIAGYYDPRLGFANEVRLVTDVYPPRINLRFKLARADGTVLEEGERKLTDPNFLMRASRYPTDGLGFEKALLDTWLRKEFPQPRKR